MKKMIFAVDPAEKAGICFGRPGQTPQTLLVETKRGNSLNAYLFEHVEKIFLMADMVKPDVVVFEEPFFNHKQPTAGVMLYQIAGALRFRFLSAGYQTLYFAPIPSWKKAFCNNGRFGKNTVPYPPIDRCHVLGIETDGDDNRADAAGIWFWAANNEEPDLHMDLPLLAG